MTGYTHVAVGALAGAAAGALSGNPAVTVTGAVGGLLPDADAFGSRGYRITSALLAILLIATQVMRVPFLNVGPAILFLVVLIVAGMLSGHRCATHSLAALGALLVVGWVSLPLPHALALWLGYASHIAADAATPGGVRLFWPGSGIVRFASIRTGSLWDFVTGAAAMLLAARIVGLI